MNPLVGGPPILIEAALIAVFYFSSHEIKSTFGVVEAIARELV